MKRVLFAILTLVFAVTYGQKDPIILKVNGEKITKSEFLQIYLKNNPNPKYDQASMDEYMDLFKKFKLKVIEAEALGYDTIPKLKREFEGYKRQLAIPYLIDSAQNDSLVREAYFRTVNEVRCSHILVKIDPSATPADTLAAYNRILALKARIDKGEDFASVARMKNGSDDPSATSNGGDLGYFTAFQMVYPFEDMAYKTAVGSVSAPFRTRFGYHILKTTGLRPSRGSIKTAHLMISVAKDADQATKDNAKKKVDEIYQKLKDGAKWEEMVAMYSDDPGTSKKGGELPMFGSGTTQRMVPEFEEASFALQADGDFSAPLKTNYGYHIIKRLERKDVAGFETIKKELQTKVNKDERSKKTQDSFVRKLKAKYKYAAGAKENLAWFEANLDSTYFMGKWNANALKSNKTLFTLDGVSFGQQQFARYLEKNYRALKKDESQMTVASQYKNWEKAAILEYEEKLLPSKYPEYRALVNEYHDGILLYEVMSDKVWNKAVKDTAGLRAYFLANRDKYMWPSRIEATVYECLNLSVANEVASMIVNDTVTSKHVIEKINKDTELNLKVKMNKFDPETTAFLKGKSLNLGVNKAYEFEGKFYVVKVTNLLPIMKKEFSEAKGSATSDYQNFLEKNWLESLTSKYKVKVNKKVLYNLGK
ncbi:MAG: peptidylprolyl isomerase [Flavobacteriales bacterium]